MLAIFRLSLTLECALVVYNNTPQKSVFGFTLVTFINPCVNILLTKQPFLSDAFRWHILGV